MTRINQETQQKLDQFCKKNDIDANDFIKQAMEDANTLAINNQRKVFKFEKFFIKHLNYYFADFNISVQPGDCLFEVKLRVNDPFYLPKQYQIIKLEDYLKKMIIDTPERKWNTILPLFDRMVLVMLDNQSKEIVNDINKLYNQRQVNVILREQQRHYALSKFYELLNMWNAQVNYEEMQ